MPVATHSRTTWRGVTTCTRAAAMLDGAMAVLILQGHADIAAGIRLAQGSYRPWSRYSANTHAGCGVVDVSRWFGVRLWTPAEWALIVAALRMVGFAAWHRFAIVDLWVEHTHAVAIGCPDLNRPDATNQVVDYLANHDGLADNAPDNGPRDWVNVTWETSQTHGSFPAPANEATATPEPLPGGTMRVVASKGKTTLLIGAGGAIATIPDGEYTRVALLLEAGQSKSLSADDYQRALNLASVLRENKGI
jgi:hypothetical protein